MHTFLDETFLLHTETARYLYFEHASTQPIIDYHNHLSPREIAEDKIFGNITEIWLKGDHYKWRAMRANGVNEEYITGKNTSDKQKFDKWAYTVPYTIRNPLYHWTHLELQRYFGITCLLNPDTADYVYDSANEFLKNPEFSTQNLLKKMRVEVICTTDDPVDTLNYHHKIQTSEFAVKVLPTFRPDKALAIEELSSWNKYVDDLQAVANVEILNFNHFVDALKKRHDYFHNVGCRISDHGLARIYASDYKLKDVEALFYKIRRGVNANADEIEQFKSAMLYILAIMDWEKGWVQQFHLGALRNNSTRLQELLGADCGADSIGDFLQANAMANFFDRLDTEGKLTKTIVYNLNPSWNEVFATMAGNFQDGSVAGKMQLGSGWWFLDQLQGMENQINALSNMGLLSRFIGMLTDSRSFLSFPRHEYFRRLLCNIIGRDVELGLLPNDRAWLGKIVEDICYYNAKTYFGF